MAPDTSPVTSVVQTKSPRAESRVVSALSLLWEGPSGGGDGRLRRVYLMEGHSECTALSHDRAQFSRHEKQSDTRQTTLLHHTTTHAH